MKHHAKAAELHNKAAEEHEQAHDALSQHHDAIMADIEERKESKRAAPQDKRGKSKQAEKLSSRRIATKPIRRKP